MHVSQTDAERARAIALAAGQLLVTRRNVVGRDGETADRAADKLITELLQRECPQDAILSEESGSRGNRLAAERVWIVDPLDGTREYGEAGRSDWAVHVALWARGRLTAGAVAMPALDRVWATDGPTSPPAQRPIRRIAVSRTRPPAWAQPVADRLGAVLVPMGSAGAKTMAVVIGEVDVYLHDGGQYEWDSAAPVAVAAHAGLHASRVDGSDLVYNQPDPWSPDLLVCPAESAALVLSEIAALRGASEACRP